MRWNWDCIIVLLILIFINNKDTTITHGCCGNVVLDISDGNGKDTIEIIDKL